MRVLALLAHPDDELACAGTLSRWAHEGHDVVLAIAHVDPRRRAELAAACRILEVPVYGMGALRDDDLSWSRASVIRVEQELEHALRRWDGAEPDLVLTHRETDENTSHGPIAQIARTLVRKNRTGLWECDTPIPGGLNPDGPATNCLVGIDGYQGRKNQACWAYASCVEKYGPAWVGAIRTRDKLNGWLLNMQREGSRFAEAFRVVKQVER